MRIIIQRVLEAQVTVEDRCVGKIGKGLLILLGVGKDDTRETVDRYVDKILKLRIFADADGKTNLSLQEVQGEVLVVSQFTLYADCRKGNRPDFTGAGGAVCAKELYEYFIENVKNKSGKAEAGEFSAEMKVLLVNDGPFTIILDERLF